MTYEMPNKRPERFLFCSRCRASVPLHEWKLSSTAESWRHIGPLRDGPDFFCDPNEDGSTECGWVLPIPTRIIV